MAKTRVLYVLHNHPTLFPGGAEQYALELFEALRGSDEIEPLLLARISRTSMPAGQSPGHSVQHASTASPISTSCSRRASPRYDYFFGTSRDKSLYTTYFADFLDDVQARRGPFPAHAAHGLRRWSRRRGGSSRRRRSCTRCTSTSPSATAKARCCAREHKNEELCLKASPRRCSECFPDIPSSEFFLRERRIKAHLDNVDLFIAPSEFLRQRYRGLGHSARSHRLRGLRPPAGRQVGRDRTTDRPRNRFGYFGQFNPYKGVETLLEAMATFEQRPDIQLRLHGANLDQQTDEFQDNFAELLERAEANVTLVGSYHPSDLPLADARHRLGRGLVTLVGELTAGDPGGVHAAPARSSAAASAGWPRR